MLFSKFKKSIFERFVRNEDGNFTVLGVIGISSAILLSGFSIDYINITQATNELQSIADAGVIAASADPDFTQAQREAIFQEVIDLRAPQTPQLSNIEFELTTGATSDDEVTVIVETSAQASVLFKDVFRNLSVVTTRSGGKADNRTVELALVLDISSSMNNNRLTAMQAAASQFVDTLLSGEGAEKVQVSMVPYGGGVRLPQSMIGLLDPPTEAETEFWAGGIWNGCFFMLPDEYQNGINPEALFQYIPTFYTFNPGGNDEENPWCPRAGNEVVGLTQNAQILKNTIANFSRSDGTVTGQAVAWGLATIDPFWRGIFPSVEAALPYQFEDNRRKIMVVMSDGGSSHLIYPNSGDFETDLPFHVPSNANRRVRTNVEQNVTQQNACEHAQARGVEMFTIGFEITNDGHIANLRNCATRDSNYFQATQSNLAEVFAKIASEVSNIRISE